MFAPGIPGSVWRAGVELSEITVWGVWRYRSTVVGIHRYRRGDGVTIAEAKQLLVLFLLFVVEFL